MQIPLSHTASCLRTAGLFLAGALLLLPLTACRQQPAPAVPEAAARPTPIIAEDDSVLVRGSVRTDRGRSSIHGAVQGWEGSMRLALVTSYGRVLGYAQLYPENGGSVKVLQSRNAWTANLIRTAGRACLDYLLMRSGTASSGLASGGCLVLRNGTGFYDDGTLQLTIGGSEKR